MRISRINAAVSFALVALLALSQGVRAQQVAPYDDDLLRLGEIMGSLHYLRNLCGEKGNGWRDAMNDLLEAEAPSPERRARIVASFNRGYRAFAATHTECTANSMAAIDRYMREGEKLSAGIASRYGN